MAFLESTSLLLRKKPIDQIIKDSTSLLDKEQLSMKRDLDAIDLTAFGIAAIVGAGIFSTIGTVAAQGGPASIFLFIFTAVTCAFAAFCYAEFASRIPISGSAYTYAYVAFGELAAWIIGWDLLMEYAISNIVVAISWSDYFTSFLSNNGIHIPEYLTLDYLSASRGASTVEEMVRSGVSLESIKSATENRGIFEAYTAWISAPRVLGIRVVLDIPALLIIGIVTAITYVGIRESKISSNVMVIIKLAVIILIISIGAVYVNPGNWTPFAPNGIKGVMGGVAGVFFAYIGFDAISTTAEECKDPQRDLPKGMLYSLLICTVLYIAIALVLTGIVSYKYLAVGDPLAFIFGPQGANIPWMSALVSISSIVCMTTVLLVYQIGQPRIWMAMSRDGLLPQIFSSIHPRFRTPWFSTLVTGALVGIPALFLNLTEVTELTSIGTLFAFLLVCAGVLLLNNEDPQGSERIGFRIPYYNSKIVIPVLFLTALILLFYFDVPLFDPKLTFLHKVPTLLFITLAGGISILCYRKNLSLIPVLGILSCAYLISELGIITWARFGIWLIVGLLLYFLYGCKNSKLRAPVL